MADGAGSLTLREAVADALEDHLRYMVDGRMNRAWMLDAAVRRIKPLEFEIVIPGSRGKTRSILVKVSERR